MASIILAARQRLHDAPANNDVLSLSHHESTRLNIFEKRLPNDTNHQDNNIEDSIRELNRINSYRRSIFLILSEPQSSKVSAIFFGILVIMILISNIILIGTTLPEWSYTPESCDFCMENSKVYTDIPCVCEPEPLPVTDKIQDFCMFFFAFELFLRVSSYVPLTAFISRDTWWQHVKQWSKILIRPSTIVDALAVFPYLLERYMDIKGLMALRLLRVFRLLLLLKVGAFSSNFQILLRVLGNSLISWCMLFLGLSFGAAFFGSMIYFCEMGEWKYTTETAPPSYTYMRPVVNGIDEEPSPYKSIPGSFWWYISTATTVGYGDYYPTTTAGKFVGTITMIAGLLVVAFPVVTFCESWATEFQDAKEAEIKESMNIDTTTDDVTTSDPVKDVDIITQADECSQNSGHSQSLMELSVRNDVDGCTSELPYNLDDGFDNEMMLENLIISESDIAALNYHISLILEHQREMDESQEQIRNILEHTGLI